MIGIVVWSNSMIVWLIILSFEVIGVMNWSDISVVSINSIIVADQLSVERSNTSVSVNGISVVNWGNVSMMSVDGISVVSWGNVSVVSV